MSFTTFLGCTELNVNLPVHRFVHLCYAGSSGNLIHVYRAIKRLQFSTTRVGLKIINHDNRNRKDKCQQVDVTVSLLFYL